MRSRALIAPFVLIFLIFAVTALSGQTAPAKPAQAPAAQPAPSGPEHGQTTKPSSTINLTPEDLAKPHPQDVPATAPVLTITGLCSTPAAGDAANCSTVVTKADFEKLATALDPKMQDQLKQQLVDTYAKMLVLSAAAEQQGVAADPRTEEVLRFVRMQALASLFNQKLQERAKEVPPDTLQKYYESHQQEFEEVSLHRIFIPKNVPPDAKKLSDAERATLAQSIDKRAKAGEDFDKLQKEVFTAMAIKTPPPPTVMERQRRMNFAPAQGTGIFAMKPGEVSDVIADTMGDFIYKVDSKQTLPLDAVKNDIERSLQAQNYQAELAKLFASKQATLNTQYFGPAAHVAFPQPAAAAAAGSSAAVAKPTANPK